MFSAAGKSAVASGYFLNNSLRFRASASASLSRTPGTAGNRRTWTWSGWVKRGQLGIELPFFQGYASASDRLFLGIDTGNTIQVYGSAGAVVVATSAVFRDPSAWYHIVFAFDTTQATAANRVKIYVNGTQQAISTGTYPSLNAQWNINNTESHQIGSSNNGVAYFDGYMAEVNFVDGQALTPSSFGQTDGVSGSWIPKPFGGSYGTNGFYLKFSDINTTSGSNAGLGKDFSGNANYWTTNNISVSAGSTYDAMTDVPTLTSKTVANYCAGNPLDVSVRGSFSNANLTATCNGGGSLNAGSVRLNTFNFTQLPVKWYWESTVTNTGGGRALFGLLTNAYVARDENWSTTGGAFLRADGLTNLTNPGTISTNDVMMFAYDGNTGKFWIGKNGTWTNSGVPASGTGQNITLTAGTEYWLVFNENTGGAGTAICHMNYGQRPFAYTPPTDFLAVNTYNIPDSTIVKGNKYMDATTYTGTGANATITNAGAFKPDLVWVKVRSTTGTHVWTDSNRGANKQLFSNLNNAEATSTIKITGFTSTGFTLGADDGTGTGDANFNGSTYVGWQWQAGSSTVTNTSGSISSQVRANPTAGFSIVTYTGNGSAGATVGHSLGVAPKMFIVKNRSNGGNDWSTWHTSISPSSNFQVYLSSTAAALNTWNVWNSTSPSSTVLTLGTDALVNGNGQTYVAYCWAEIPGFSAFGRYTANASADGPFIYTGFRPRWIMFKRTTSATNWYVIDTAISPYNSSTTGLYPNTNDAESTEGAVDILSNGFKCRVSSGAFNYPGGETFIYAAFAENPFKNSNAR